MAVVAALHQDPGDSRPENEDTQAMAPEPEQEKPLSVGILVGSDDVRDVTLAKDVDTDIRGNSDGWRLVDACPSTLIRWNRLLLALPPENRDYPSLGLAAAAEALHAAGFAAEPYRVRVGERLDDFGQRGRIEEELIAGKIELVVQGGWLCYWKIPPSFTNRVMNIHRALLPSFGG